MGAHDASNGDDMEDDPEIQRLPPEVRQRRARALQARNRLIDQARPAQIRILHSFGASNTQLLQSSRSSEEEVSQFAGRLVQDGQASAPLCVCGSALERVTSHERARRTIQRLAPWCPLDSQEFTRLVQHITGSEAFISCDLCRSSVPPTSDVWTCANGNRTILHANAYDVCENCFARYVLASSSVS